MVGKKEERPFFEAAPSELFVQIESAFLDFYLVYLGIPTRGNRKIEEALGECGYTQTEVVDHLGIHFSCISRITRKGKGMLQIDLIPA